MCGTGDGGGGVLKKSLPVSCNFNIQCHLDIEQILVLPQVTGHLTLSGPQLILQLRHVVLKKKINKNKARKNKKIRPEVRFTEMTVNQKFQSVTTVFAEAVPRQRPLSILLLSTVKEAN